MKLLWCVGVFLVSVTTAKIQTPTASERPIGHRIHVDDMNQEVVAKHRQKLQMHHKEFMAKLQAAESAPVKSQGAAKMPSFFEKGSVVQPVAARLSKEGPRGGRGGGGGGGRGRDTRDNRGGDRGDRESSRGRDDSGRDDGGGDSGYDSGRDDGRGWDDWGGRGRDVGRAGGRGGGRGGGRDGGRGRDGRDSRDSEPTQEFMAKLQAAESAPVKSQGAAKMPSFFEKGSVVQPVAARLSKGELEAFLKKLSADCEKQFTQLLKGEGQVHKLHQFGTKDHNTTESSCQDLEGALCSTHARVQQRAESKVAGRRLVSKSDVKGESCLPRSCIQDHDLHLVAGMMQQKAVESLGASMAGEQPAEVLLDVDCSASGGASYSSTSEWSMEEAGPTHSAATIPSFILPIFVIMAILSS